MEKKKIPDALKALREAKKRKFSQSVDLVVSLRDLNLKNPEEQLDFFVAVSRGVGRKMKVAAFVGPELKERADGVVDFVISQSDFSKYSDKKLAKKLASDYDFFIAQADVMPQVATTFGRVFGPRGKMPNPKLGSVLPGKAPVEPVFKKLQNTVRVQAKKTPTVQVKIGNESMKDEDLIENINQVFNQIVTHLPKERSNVKRVLIKTTMGSPIELDM